MYKTTFTLSGVLVCLFLLCVGAIKTNAQNIPFSVDKYHKSSEIKSIFKELEKSKKAKLHVLTKTPGNNEVIILEIGTEINSKQKNKPAIFIAGNMEGNLPLATEACVYLANDIANSTKKIENYTWYILPTANPDALNAFFDKTKYENNKNASKVNDDNDDQTNEDGFDDLNKDGYITKMRVKTPNGQWLTDENEPRLMRKAKTSDGETGIYTIYTEGIDNDNDGQYNEDPTGGVNIGITFPHQFDFFKPEAGKWPGSESETYQIMKFIYERPEISMTFTFGETNYCKSLPKSDNKGSADLEKVKIPKYWADYLGANPSAVYSIDEIVEMAQTKLKPQRQLNAGDVFGYIKPGKMLNPLKEDIENYKAINEKYAEYLKKKGIKEDRQKPKDAKNGSFELWSYFHLGVPTFSMDLWSLPKHKPSVTIDSLQKMDSIAIIKLGKENLDNILKENMISVKKLPENYFEQLKDNKIKIQDLLKTLPKDEKPNGNQYERDWLAFSDNELQGKGFVDWKTFQHPKLGEVEIGGFVAYSGSCPPVKLADSLISSQVPFIYEIVDLLPNLEISDVKTEPKGNNVYSIELWIENKSAIAFPTAMGVITKRIQPLIVRLQAKDLVVLDGQSHTAVSEIKANSKVKLNWLVKTKKNTKLTIELSSKNALTKSKTINIGG